MADYVIRDIERISNPTPAIGPAQVTIVYYHVTGGGLRTIRIDNPNPDITVIVTAIREDWLFREKFVGHKGTL